MKSHLCVISSVFSLIFHIYTASAVTEQLSLFPKHNMTVHSPDINQRKMIFLGFRRVFKKKERKKKKIKTPWLKNTQSQD